MSGGGSKRATFMIADLLYDVSASTSSSLLPQEVHDSDSRTGSDVIVDEVVDCSAQSPTTATTRGRTQSNRLGEQGTNHRLGREDLFHNCEEKVPDARDALFSSAERFPLDPVPCRIDLLQCRVPSSSCFPDADVLPGGGGHRQDLDVTRLSLPRTADRCVTPLRWHAVIQHALHAAGWTNSPAESHHQHA